MTSDSLNEDPKPASAAKLALAGLLKGVPDASNAKRRLLELACDQLGAQTLDFPAHWILPPSSVDASRGSERKEGQEADPGMPRTNLSHLDLMSGRQFERFLGEAFESKGYEVQFDAGPTEAGGDLVCWERSSGKRHAILVQAKRERCLTGTKAIGQILRKENAFRRLYPNATYEKWVVSSSRFSSQAQTEAVSGEIRLVDRDALAVWLAGE